MALKNVGRGVLCVALPVALFCLALALNFRGLQWARLHPDERLIAKWTAETARQPFITDRAYPGGFFELYRPVRVTRRLAADTASRVRAWQRQHGAPEPHEAKPEDLILTVRRVNAVMIALASLVIYWTARRIFRSAAPDAGLATIAGLAGLAGFLHATSPFLVEHAHYAETDGAMALTGALAIAMLTEALVRRSVRWLAWGACMTGFAVGCKYTLIPLLTVLPVSAIVLCRMRGCGGVRTVGWAVGLLFLAAAGFALATPSVYRDFAFFTREMRAAGEATWGEMHGLLGRMHATPGARRALKGRFFLREAVTLGVGHWLWLGCAVPFWLVKPLRPQLAVLPLFALCFPLYVVFVFPWFRNQEFIPMLPFFCITAVLPLAVFAGMRPRRTAVRLAVPLAASAILAVSVVNLRDACRMASAFAGEDSRMAFGAWVRMCAPADRSLGVERYTDRPRGYAPLDDFSIGKNRGQPP